VPEDHLLPFMAIHRSKHFLHDSAPCHASKRIKDFLKDKPFEVIDWLGNLPDLNPIEHTWNFMKNKLRTQDISSIPKLKEAIPKLKEAILKLWTHDISTEYLSNLSNFMPKRIEAVIKN
jgi:transposase